MKKNLFTILCLFLTLTIQAQEKPNEKGRRQFSPEQFRHELEAFVAHEANLTETEGQKFFPMLHEMRSKQRKNNEEAYRLMRSCNESTTEPEYSNIITKCLMLDIQNKNIENEYYIKFSTVLSWKKIYKVRNALFRFNMHALQRFSPQRNGKGWNGPHPRK